MNDFPFAEALYRTKICQNFSGRHLAIKAPFLGHIPYAIFDLLDLAIAQYLYSAAVGPDDIHNHPKSGRLSGTIRAKEAVDTACGDLDAQVIHGVDTAKGFTDIFKRYSVHIRWPKYQLSPPIVITEAA
jgi:hypothetical protein